MGRRRHGSEAGALRDARQALSHQRLVREAATRKCALAAAPLAADERTFTLTNGGAFKEGRVRSAPALVHPSLPVAVLGWR